MDVRGRPTGPGPRRRATAAGRSGRAAAEELGDLAEGADGAEVLRADHRGPGSRSCRAARISTRLIESMPRSASSCMPGSSTSAG